MSTKAVNRLFLTFFIVEMAVSGIMSWTGWQPQTMLALLLNQLILLVPAIVFLCVTKTSPSFIQHKKIHWSTPFLSVVYTALCMPVVMLANLISMLFVDNAVTSIAGQLYGVGAWQMILLIGILGPMNEEFIFRGIIYHSYRKSGRMIGAMLLSAVLFGLMHLNFNQMSYAIVVGIMTVLLIEATGSIVSSMIFHICVNTYNVILMIVQKDEMLETQDAQVVLEEALSMIGMTYHQFLVIMIGVFFIISLMSITLAGLLLCGMAKIEGNQEKLKNIFRKQDSVHQDIIICEETRYEHQVENQVQQYDLGKSKKKRLFTPSLIVAMLFCIGYMIWGLF